MKAEAAATSVTESITVEVPRERAFEVFTERFGDWFPRAYNLLPVEIEERTFEPRVGGRIIDRGTDGSECSWGKVLAYEPPERVVFAWAISPIWQLEVDESKVSEVEVRFTKEAPGRTRVDLEHRHLDRHGDGWEHLRAAVAAEGGWPFCLQAFAELVNG